MVSRNIVRTGLRIFLWALALATAVASSFLGIAAILAVMYGSPVLGSDNLFLALICAVIAWFFVAFFHFGRETIYLPVTQPVSYLRHAGRILEEMGYEVTRPSSESLATRRGFQFLLIGRGILVQCVDQGARITGPKLWVDVLKRRLRVASFLEGTQLSLTDSQRLSGLLLKRLQIRMRVQPDNLEEVARHVVQVLAQEADVVCELSILAQSDNGIRESTVDRRVRPWLNEHGITADIHKDLVKMCEPLTDSHRLAAVRKAAVAQP